MACRPRLFSGGTALGLRGLLAALAAPGGGGVQEGADAEGSSDLGAPIWHPSTCRSLVGRQRHTRLGPPTEPIPLWTLRTRANTRHRDYAKYSKCKSVSAAPLLRSLAIVGARGGVLRGWCASPGPRRRRHRSGEAPVVTPARVRRHRAPSDGGDRWRPEAPSTRRAGCTRVLPPTRHFCTRASTLADGEAARVGHRSPKALHPYPVCAPCAAVHPNQSAVAEPNRPVTVQHLINNLALLGWCHSNTVGVMTTKAKQTVGLKGRVRAVTSGPL